MTSEPDLAGRVVELARQHAGPDAEVEVLVTSTDLALTRFANSVIHQNVADATTRVRLRLHLSGRTAAGSTTVLGADGLRDLVDRTIAAARLCPPDHGWPGLTPPAATRPAADVDEATARAEPAERARRVRDFVAAGEGLEAAGYCRTVRRSAAFANSAGHAAYGHAADAAMDGIVRYAGADGVARLASSRLAGIDGAVLGARAAAKARAGAGPVELPPGEYEVVLEPAAVADVLANLAYYGFNGKDHIERQSFAEVGTAQFDPSITMVDDAPGTPALPFDTEGTPRGRLVLVEDGITRAVTHNRRTAAEAGTASTGHELTASSFGPMPLSLSLLPAGATAGPADRFPAGDADRPGADRPGAVSAGPPAEAAGLAEAAGPAADAEVSGLLTGVRRGLLVSDLWYTRVLDPLTLVVTGLTRNGVWLIEDGEVTRPVRDFRFTQSYPRALAPGAVLGLGRAAVRQPDSWDSAWWTAPAVRLARWNFTGGAAG
ncbi:metallopeptidase TldD-related protein [Plantactinospora sp. GCM10030261]|uniref:metallopeptidase TldD-related protein n=1 Tax=Plantactinospora sp. GCM10030261 TaxID=3273420 RepID=UPI003614A9F4